MSLLYLTCTERTVDVRSQCITRERTPYFELEQGGTRPYYICLFVLKYIRTIRPITKKKKCATRSRNKIKYVYSRRKTLTEFGCNEF